MPDTHFVVERLNWRRVDGNFYRLPGQTRVAAFDTFEDAEAFRAAEEDRARRVVNPFAGGLAVPFDQTHWQPEVLCDWLLDHDIDPPQFLDSKRDWAGWWDRESPGWTDDQRRAAWQPLDKVEFFRLRETPKRPVAYAVVQVQWAYDDSWYQASPEGGEVQTLYRRRERAEAEAARLTVEARRERAEYDPALDLDQRPDPGQDPFDPPRTVPFDKYDGRMIAVADAEFYEVVAVELAEDAG